MHSTLQGKRVVQDSLKSNNFRISFVCSTHKDNTPQESPHKCEYISVLRRSKAKAGECSRFPWALKKGTKPSDLQHSVGCLSQPQMTFREAMVSHESVLHGPQDSISITKHKLASFNKIATASVSSHVSQRFRLQQLYAGCENDVVNWGKLDEWGRSLVAKNPGSHFHLKVDDEGRFERMFVGLGCTTRIAIATGLSFSEV